ncbi:hypothetical protein SLE2022_271830 [Rubroshorea leprosula]
MAGYSDDDSFGGYSDDQCSTRGYSDDQYSDGGYSDYEQLSAGGYTDNEEQDSDDDEDESGGYNPVAATKEYDYSGKQTVSWYEPSGKQTVPYHEPRPRKQSSSYQRTAKAGYMDKQTGNYIRTTAKDVISTGETFKERGSAGRVGTKNEYSTTNTYRVGDQSGFSEYQVQERFRRVDYGGSSSSSQGNYGNKGYYNGGYKYSK